MARILEELYYGNIDPNTKGVKTGSVYDKAARITIDNEEKLLMLLSGKEKDLLIDLLSAQSEILGITTIETFRLYNKCWGIDRALQNNFKKCRAY